LIALRTLGGIDLRDAQGHELRSVLAQPKRLALLALLALESTDHPCRRDTLLGLFWPDLSSERARGALRQALSFLRRQLGPDVVRGKGDGDLRVNTAALACDATAFERACAEGRDSDALETYRGDFMAGLFIPDASPEFDEWLEGRRGGLRRQAIAAATRLIAKCRKAGQSEVATHWTRRAIGLSPDDEELQRTLFELLDESGDRAGVIRAYEEFASSLMRQLGVAPSTATQALLADIRAGRRGERTAPSALSHDPRKSVAVLTFANMTGHHEHDFLCHALTEEIRVLLSHAQDIRVVPVTGPYALKGREPNLEKIRRLNVNALLDGTVWRQDATVHISAHLIDIETGDQLWADSQKRELQHIDALLGQLARTLANGIQLTLTGRQASFNERPTASVEAYNLYLKGRYFWNQRPRVSDKTLQYLGQAIEIEPTFALAHAGIADAYNTLGAWEASMLPPMEAFPKAHAAAVRALELDPHLAEAHTALGYANTHYLWDWSAAEAQFRHALKLKPNYGHAHHWLSHLMLARGRVDESLASSFQALECDPLDPVINIHLAWHYWFARQYDQALEQCERTAELDPNEQWAPMFSGFAHVERGAAAAAIDAHRIALQRSNGSPVMLGALGYSYAAGGERKLARGILKRLEDAGAYRGMYGYEMGIIHGALRDFDRAFDCLNRAQRERSTWLAYLGVDPRLDRLRSDPRFGTLLQAIGLDKASTITTIAAS
jgi:DNA-binding SARP family transcriptional activator/Flp pilus assembly protein TadD